jgi:hypothetical protein
LLVAAIAGIADRVRFVSFDRAKVGAQRDVHVTPGRSPTLRCKPAPICPFIRRNFDADSHEHSNQDSSSTWLGLVRIRQGVLVMGNVYSQSTENQFRESAPLEREDDGFDTDVDSELVSLLEENARLRSLVVQLSDLVLKNVLEQK